MAKQTTTPIGSPARRVFPWHGTYWAVLTACLLVRAAFASAVGSLWVLLVPSGVLIAGSVLRPAEYALSRRHQPWPLVALLLASLVTAAVAVATDATGWRLTLASLLPALPTGVVAYLHLRTPPAPPVAAVTVR